MNLTIALLSARQFLSKERIRQMVEGYKNLDDTTFDRQFERDKDELRAMGVPIVTGSNSAFFTDEAGYKISRSDFELPEISFDLDELSVLGAAARVWQQANAAEQTISALAKLRASGIDPDMARLDALAPQITAKEPAFDVCRRATLDRQALTFVYRGSEQLRTVQPWRLFSRKGSWYVLALDMGKNQSRIFKLGRMADVPRVVGEPGAFEIPHNDELDARIADFGVQAAQETALLAIRDDYAPRLRRIGKIADFPKDMAFGFDNFSCFEVPYAHRGDFIAEIAANSPNVVVLGPADLRADVVKHLQEVVRVCEKVTAS